MDYNEFKHSCSRAVAEVIAQTTEKGEMISAVFNYYKLDCLERNVIDHEGLDAKIARFHETDGQEVELLTDIIDIIKAGKANTRNQENAILHQATTYIDDHLTEEIRVEEIAKECNVGYHYLCHLFKNKFGTSVNTYRTKKRLEVAMKALLNGDEKITDIALSCGFCNGSYFTEVFTKTVGISPKVFRDQYRSVFLHPFYGFDDILSAKYYPSLKLLGETVSDLRLPFETVSVHEPDQQFGFLHEAAIIEYHGVLYASWYNCPKHELQGYTPICGKRSRDGGKSWSELEILCEEKTGKLLYCPPVYGICDDTLYMFVNQMVAPDHIHALDLYRLNNESGRFERLWSRPIPFKLNTNVVTLPNGKRMLPGRIGALDRFPNTPAVLISDSGRMDDEWRLVKIAEDGNLPDGTELRHPEISVMQAGDRLIMFNRNDRRRVPLAYLSEDQGESWSQAYRHDIPYVNSKMYAGTLACGRHYLVANIDRADRSRLALYFTDKNSEKFTKRLILFDKKTTRIQGASMCHYPVAHESNGKLYIIATLSYESNTRGAVLFIVDLKDIP
ncbi:MAG: exo-alpha-sialidase [Clostridia bacterium]|nr:exo-alpha-sialidase [Clostridia bacterium]